MVGGWRDSNKSLAEMTCQQHPVTEVSLDPPANHDDPFRLPGVTFQKRSLEDLGMVPPGRIWTPDLSQPKASTPSVNHLNTI